MGAGQPTKYKGQETCDEVLELFKVGASIAEICLEISICKETFYTWKERHPEFLDAIKEGMIYSQGVWEKKGRLGAFGKEEINPTLWFMNMKNRFGKIDQEENIVWKDKQDIDHSSSDGSMTPAKTIDVSLLTTEQLKAIKAAKVQDGPDE